MLTNFTSRRVAVTAVGRLHTLITKLNPGKDTDLILRDFPASAFMKGVTASSN
jgi:hypothetical protein